MEENTKKPLTLSGTLGLKKPLSGSQIRQTVGGQSKFVQVEVRKKRTIGGSTSPTTSVLSDAAQAQKLKLLMEAKKLEEVKAKKRAEEEAQRAKEREEMKRQEELLAAEQEAARQKAEREAVAQKKTIGSDNVAEKSADKSHDKGFKKKYSDDAEPSFKERKKAADDQMSPSKKGKNADERRW